MSPSSPIKLTPIAKLNMAMIAPKDELPLSNPTTIANDPTIHLLHVPMTGIPITVAMVLADLFGDSRSGSSASHSWSVSNVVGASQESGFVPLITGAILPCDAAAVAKLVLAEASIMKIISSDRSQEQRRDTNVMWLQPVESSTS